MLFVLQKGSPYLDDANDLIHLATQIGFIDTSFYSHMPNSTSCNTIKQIDESHSDGLVILEMDAIYGMLILLGVGWLASIAVFAAEQVPMVRAETPLSELSTRIRVSNLV